MTINEFFAELSNYKGEFHITHDQRIRSNIDDYCPIIFLVQKKHNGVYFNHAAWYFAQSLLGITPLDTSLLIIASDTSFFERYIQDAAEVSVKNYRNRLIEALI